MEKVIAKFYANYKFRDSTNDERLVSFEITKDKNNQSMTVYAYIYNKPIDKHITESYSVYEFEYDWKINVLDLLTEK